jgi:hypothetical protein
MADRLDAAAGAIEAGAAKATPFAGTLLRPWP